MIGLLDKLYFKMPRFRRFITKLLDGNKDRMVNLMGQPVCVNSLKEQGYLMASRIQKLSALFKDEVPILQVFAYLLPRMDCIVDAGANVGVYSKMMARFTSLHPFYQYAFEANPDTFSRLSETLKGTAIVAHNFALAEKEGVLEFVPGAVSHVFTTVENFSKWSIKTPPMKIPARRLDSFDIKGDRILLKIDVEGQELAVLRGASELFDSGRISAVYIDGYKDSDVPDFLKKQGFELLDGRSLEVKSDGKCHSLLGLKK